MSEIITPLCALCKCYKKMECFMNPLGTKKFKCCDQCRETSKSKYVKVEKKNRPTSYKIRPPPSDADTHYKCTSCHYILTIDNFIIPNGKRKYKCCNECRLKRKELYKQSKLNNTGVYTS